MVFGGRSLRKVYALFKVGSLLSFCRNVFFFKRQVLGVVGQFATCNDACQSQAKAQLWMREVTVDWIFQTQNKDHDLSHFFAGTSFFLKVHPIDKTIFSRSIPTVLTCENDNDLTDVRLPWSRSSCLLW